MFERLNVILMRWLPSMSADVNGQREWTMGPRSKRSPLNFEHVTSRPQRTDAITLEARQVAFV